MYDRGALWSYLECEFLLGWTMAEWPAPGPDVIQASTIPTNCEESQD